MHLSKYINYGTYDNFFFKIVKTINNEKYVTILYLIDDHGTLPHLFLYSRNEFDMTKTFHSDHSTSYMKE